MTRSKPLGWLPSHDGLMRLWAGHVVARASDAAWSVVYSDRFTAETVITSGPAKGLDAAKDAAEGVLAGMRRAIDDALTRAGRR